MNDEDDYFDGDISDREYRQRYQREQARDEFYAREREAYKKKRKTIYSPSEDSDSGSMW
jgi:hypothetical protein